MCGRFSFAATREKVKKQIASLKIVDAKLDINYNIAPSHTAYVISNQEPDKLQQYQWGLVPYWTEDVQQAGKPINARCEDIHSRPSFRMPIRQKRCLVLADSFYEWQQQGAQKTPYRILPKDNSLLLMGGIWDVWKSANQVIHSFAIITTSANADIEHLHERMPVLLTNEEAQQRWLSDLDLNEISEMMKPAPLGFLQAYPISEMVNSPKHNTIDLHREVPVRPNLFS